MIKYNLSILLSDGQTVVVRDVCPGASQETMDKVICGLDHSYEDKFAEIIGGFAGLGVLSAKLVPDCSEGCGV